MLSLGSNGCKIMWATSEDERRASVQNNFTSRITPFGDHVEEIFLSCVKYSWSLKQIWLFGASLGLDFNSALGYAQDIGKTHSLASERCTACMYNAVCKDAWILPANQHYTNADSYRGWLRAPLDEVLCSWFVLFFRNAFYSLNLRI